MTTPIFHDCPLSERPHYVVFEHTGPRRGLPEFWKVTASVLDIETAKRWAGATANDRGDTIDSFIYECPGDRASALYHARQRYSDDDVRRFQVIGGAPIGGEARA